MATETKTKEIDGTTYKLEILGALEGQRVALKVIKLLAPVAGAVLSGGDLDLHGKDPQVIKVMAMAADAEALLGRALTALGEAVSEDDFAAICSVFAKRTRIVRMAETKAGPQPVEVSLADCYDQHFSRRYRALTTWLVWCIQENFADFFGSGLSGVFRRKGDPVESESAPPKG